MKPNITPLIEIYKIGHGLSDKELLILGERMGLAADVLLGMGPTFELSFKEANRIFIECVDFLVARNILSTNAKYNVKLITELIDERGIERGL
jgi:hypothetical protein